MRKIFVAGLAMFSMFFGSGNLVFPIALGQVAAGQAIAASLGLFLTAIVVPFLGVLGMILYGGSHRTFFQPIGRLGQLLVCGLIIALIGPFGVLPRCFTISYASVALYFPGMPLLLFSALAAALVFAIMGRRVLGLLGSLLSPPLLLSLFLIVLLGWLGAPAAPAATLSQSAAFGSGLVLGYQTLDLLAAFFFASSIVGYFREEEGPVLPAALKAGAIGMGLLALVYASFIFLGAHYGFLLEGMAQQQLILAIAHHLLGPWGGLVAAVAIGLACLTTAIALASVSAQFLSQDLLGGRWSERQALVPILLVSIAVSALDFQGIATYLGPILFWCYPFMILLTVVNIARKLVQPRALAKNI